MHGAGRVFTVFMPPQAVKALDDLLINFGQHMLEHFPALADRLVSAGVWTGRITPMDAFSFSFFF